MSAVQRCAAALAVILQLAWLSLSGPALAASAKADVPLYTSPVTIAVLVTSRSNQCYDPGYAAAIRKMAAFERDRINESGGVAGRQLQLQFLDDDGDGKKTVADVRSALADKDVIALVGLASSARAQDVFNALGKEIEASGMPWISNISVNSIFEDHPNVFTMRGAQEDDSIPVMAQFLKDIRSTRPAFIGIKDQIYSSALGDGIKEQLGGQTAFVGDHRLTLTDGKTDTAEIAAMIEDLKRANPDFLFVAIGGSRMAELLAELEKAGIQPPAMISGRLESIFSSGQASYSGDLYQLAWDGLPDTYSDRLRQHVFRTNARELLFEGARNAAASGWKDGSCADRAPPSGPPVLTSGNLRALGIGLQFSDMVGMIAQTLSGSGLPDDNAVLRAAIIKGISQNFAAGRGVYQGNLENWSFRPASRAAARTPFIIMRPKGLGAEQLAPIQYVSLRNDTLRRIQTLYLDVDLTRAFRIDDAEKSFFAEFYLSMHHEKGESLDQIEFANAFLDPQTNNKQITIRPLHQGGASDAYPASIKIYAVSGKFMFRPDFGNYPFDTQRFSIDIRSKSGDAPFIIQPSPTSLRDQSVNSEGWEVREQYAGYDADFLPVIDARSHERSIVPFYKSSFVWIMQREATDYYLTVVVPLAFIMIIAYLSIFIPQSHFEAIVTIQVTALLSAVALYLTIPKVDSDQATISDKIFLFNYMLISLMIGISILRVNRVLANYRRFEDALGVLHVFGIPLLVALMVLYVVGSSMSDGQTASSFWSALRNVLWP